MTVFSIGRILRAVAQINFGAGGARLCEPQHVQQSENPWKFPAPVRHSGLLRVADPRSVPFGQHALATATSQVARLRKERRIHPAGHLIARACCRMNAAFHCEALSGLSTADCADDTDFNAETQPGGAATKTECSRPRLQQRAVEGRLVNNPTRFGLRMLLRPGTGALRPRLRSLRGIWGIALRRHKASSGRAAF